MGKHRSGIGFCRAISHSRQCTIPQASRSLESFKQTYNDAHLICAWLHPGAQQAERDVVSRETRRARGGAARGDQARAAGDSLPPSPTDSRFRIVRVVGRPPLRALPASADRLRPSKSCLKASLKYAASVPCARTPVFPPHPLRQRAGRAVLHSRAKPVRVVGPTASSSAPSGGGIERGGPTLEDPSLLGILSLEDLILIYRTAHSTEAGADPFRDAAIMHLKDPFEAYLARHPERVKALEDQPRIVSDPEEASVAFDVIVVPADPAQNIEAVVKRWQTQFLYHELAQYKILPGQILPLPHFNERKKDILLVLLAFEIRYLRGSEITWVSDSGPGQGPTSGPYCLPDTPDPSLHAACWCSLSSRIR